VIPLLDRASQCLQAAAMRLFAQVMPITDGGNLGGLRLIVNWTVVATLDELALRKQKQRMRRSN
jgi:hypothetical protein